MSSAVSTSSSAVCPMLRHHSCLTARQFLSSSHRRPSFVQSNRYGKPQRMQQCRPLQVLASKTQKFASFDDMIQGSELPLLVDFYATWCGPCQLMARTVEDVSKKLDGSVKIVKVDTDKYPKLASKYQIQALPTLVLFHQGKPIDRIEGFLPENQLESRLRYFLKDLK